MSSNDNTSTLKSTIDAVTGAAQNALGSLTGSTADQTKGEAKQNKAEAEHDASHATAKIPGFTASSSGAVTKDDPDRSAGQYNQTVGSAKEALGGLVGSESIQAAGRNQNRQGQDQEAKGQVNDYVGGAREVPRLVAYSRRQIPGAWWVVRRRDHRCRVSLTCEMASWDRVGRRWLALVDLCGACVGGSCAGLSITDQVASGPVTNAV
ncbi:hypothetical protein CHU98_g6941 [Xylaria longipes]|nr:hypothetical protein CHU98_g6941 [Xylaria longipes]